MQINVSKPKSSFRPDGEKGGQPVYQYLMKLSDTFIPGSYPLIFLLQAEKLQHWTSFSNFGRFIDIIC